MASYGSLLSNGRLGSFEAISFGNIYDTPQSVGYGPPAPSGWGPSGGMGVDAPVGGGPPAATGAASGVVGGIAAILNPLVKAGVTVYTAKLQTDSQLELAKSQQRYAPRQQGVDPNLIALMQSQRQSPLPIIIIGAIIIVGFLLILMKRNR